MTNKSAKGKSARCGTASLKKKCAELEARCKEYESWLAAISEHAPFEFYIKDQDSRYLFVNDAFEHTVGKPRSELISKGPSDIFEEGHAGRVLKMDRKVMFEGALKRVIPCDLTGTQRTFEETRFPVFNADGEPTGLGCFALETTEQSSAEESLDQAQHVARLGNWRWSLQKHCLVSCSDTFAELHGVDRDQIFGLMETKVDSVIHPYDRESYREFSRKLFKSPRDYEIEYRLLNPNDDVVHVKEIARLALNSAGEPLEFVGTLQDISSIKAAEKELRQAHDELETRVEERTAELRTEIHQRKETEKQLQIAKLTAEAVGRRS